MRGYRHVLFSIRPAGQNLIGDVTLYEIGLLQLRTRRELAMALAASSPELRVDFDAEEAPDGILLCRSNVGDRPSGVTAFDFRQNWRDRRKALLRAGGPLS